MTDRYRANYALLEFLEHLGPNADSFSAPWAEFVGNRSSSTRGNRSGSAGRVESVDEEPVEKPRSTDRTSVRI